MHFPSSMTRMVLAGSLSVATLAGCPNAGTAPPLPGDGKFSPAPGASGAPTSAAPSAAATGTSATASPTGTASGAPSTDGSAAPSPAASGTSNPAPSGEVTILQGKIYDEEGATVEGASVAIKSLDTRQSFSATATSQGGNYVVNNVPVGVQLEISVTKTGWTRRTRVTSLQARVTGRNVLDFGTTGTQNSDDAAGEAYFLSDYPEITAATPGASPAAGDKLQYKVRFSEPLNSENQARVRDAFIIDTAAAPTDLVPDVIAEDDDEAGERIAITENSSFLDGNERVKFTWNAEGTEMTVDFAAPLRKLDDEEKSYRFRLLRNAGEDLIEDAAGNTLGYVDPDEGTAYYAVKKASLVFDTDVATAELRWQATHQQSSSFSVAEDEERPKLVSVSTSNRNRTDRGGEFLQVDLTFSEPMRVYPDDRGYQQELIDLDSYTFAFSQDSDDLDGVDMDDDETFDPEGKTDSTDFEDDVSGPQQPVKFADDGDLTDESDDVFIEVSDEDTKVVSVFLPKAMLPTDLEQIKVKVETSVKDPAGNMVSEANEDSAKGTADNVVIGDI